MVTHHIVYDSLNDCYALRKVIASTVTVDIEWVSGEELLSFTYGDGTRFTGLASSISICKTLSVWHNRKDYWILPIRLGTSVMVMHYDSRPLL